MMKKFAARVLVGALLALALGSCQGDSSQSYTQNKDGIVALFQLSPSSPVMMEPVSLSLSLTGSGGEPIEEAQVSYDLTMPGMTMPPNKPQARYEGRGVYMADATFTMAGEWRAQAVVIYGGETTTFTFDFSVQ
jgi:hypothetical protein